MRVKNIFIKETSDNLTVLEHELNKPEGAPLSAKAVEMVIRTMHNIKGTAPMVGFNVLPEIAILIEKAYKIIQSDAVEFNACLVHSKTQVAVSVIQELLANDDAHTPKTKEEQSILIDFFNDINRLKAQTNDR